MIWKSLALLALAASTVKALPRTPDTTTTNPANPTGSGTGTTGNNPSGTQLRGLLWSPTGTAPQTNPFDSQSQKFAWNYDGVYGPMPSLSGVEFVPMYHDTGANNGGQFLSKYPAGSQPSGVSYMLSLNEPDLSSEVPGVPMKVGDAVAAHVKTFGTNAKPSYGDTKIGSIAVCSNDDVNNQAIGLGYMKQWLTGCVDPQNDCKVDFMAVHWYPDNDDEGSIKSNVQSLTDHISNSCDAWNSIVKNKPCTVWLTEFGYGTGHYQGAQPAVQAEFLKQALPALAKVSNLERYAYFLAGPSDGQNFMQQPDDTIVPAYVGS
ncbi:MAG: hypothetical protein Q9227_002282 [Pyrenula ochraceoflavens]